MLTLLSFFHRRGVHVALSLLVIGPLVAYAAATAMNAKAEEASAAAAQSNARGQQGSRQVMGMYKPPAGQKESRPVIWNDPSVLREDGGYSMWASQGVGGPKGVAIYKLRSRDGETWQVENDGRPVLQPGDKKDFDSLGVETPMVVKVGDTYHMYYSAYPHGKVPLVTLGHAVSSDGVNWRKMGELTSLTARVGDKKGNPWGWLGRGEPAVVHYNGLFHLYFTDVRCRQENCKGTPAAERGISLATSRDGHTFEQRGNEPIVKLSASYPVSEGWEGYSTPWVLIQEGKFELFADVFRAVGKQSLQTSLTHLRSDDGVRFTEVSAHLMREGSDEWTAVSIRSPSVVVQDGTWKMWYAGDNYDPAQNKARGSSRIDAGIGLVNLPSQGQGVQGARAARAAEAIGPVVEAIRNAPASARPTPPAPPAANRSAAPAAAVARTSAQGGRQVIGMYKPPAGQLEKRPVIWNDPSVLYEDGGYSMWATLGAEGPKDVAIYKLRSRDGETWQVENGGRPVLQAGGRNDFDSLGVETPVVIRVDATYHMYYSAYPHGKVPLVTMGHVVSNDGLSWRKLGELTSLSKPVGENRGNPWGRLGRGEPAVVHHDGLFHLYFTDVRCREMSCKGTPAVVRGISLATSRDGHTFEQRGSEPILLQTGSYPASEGWEGYSTPWILVQDGKFELFADVFRAIGKESIQTSLTHLRSDDGVRFSEVAAHVMREGKDEWTAVSIRSPSVVVQGGVWKMWYAGDNYDPAQKKPRGSSRVDAGIGVTTLSDR